MTRTGLDRTAGLSRSTLSPRQAAQLAQVGKSTIMRAIDAGDLQAMRDNRNQWQIERDALDKWTADRPGPVPDRPGPARGTVPDRPGSDRGPTLDHLSAIAQELAAARAEADHERTRADQLAIQLEERAGLDEQRTAELAAARVETDQLAIRLEERAALVATAEARTVAAELDRDRWREMAERLTERPPVAPAPPVEIRRRRWWPF